ncbi:MAG: cation transporting ATPase C-terminal domain-containing protein, partial [Candidatus Nitrotoga sp.]|nr:cation transporting ATPase C-terminal domain-containing protein [Candidatus Nitrotoga sp.]MDO9447946.1 cation transporting ATPase C-terminal domain-containing protein [Candidatus Nitrotoga sp.]
KLWLALLGVLMLQILVVNWPPAQGVFGTTALELDDWFKAVAVASSVLLLDELKKFMVLLARKFYAW